MPALSTQMSSPITYVLRYPWPRWGMRILHTSEVLDSLGDGRRAIPHDGKVERQHDDVFRACRLALVGHPPELLPPPGDEGEALVAHLGQVAGSLGTNS